MGLFSWLDLWSKERVFSTLKSGEVYVAIPGTLHFRRSLNDGAVFGSFTGYVAVFVVASVAAAGFVLYMFGTSRPAQRVLHVGLALILAGAMGNQGPPSVRKVHQVQSISGEAFGLEILAGGVCAG